MAEPLARDDRLNPMAMANAVAGPDLAQNLNHTAADGERAAAAICCGRDGYASAAPALQQLLANDGVGGRAAAWALAQLNAVDLLLAAAAEGGIDQRENAYFGLAVFAAGGHASADLGDRALDLVGQEIERAQAGRSGLGEYATRILAILGDDRTEATVQQVTDADPYTDRFELQRQRKAFADDGRDRASIEELTADWQELFADHLLAQTTDDEPTANATDPIATEPVSDPVSDGAPPTDPEPPAASDQPDGDHPDAEAPPPAPSLDIEAFLATPEGQALDPQLQGLLGQVMPMYEQVAAQAVGAPLASFSSEEFMAVTLQVLPQALPPQYLQALLSPPSLNALQALFAWHASTTGESGLLEGVKLVRQQLQAQMRQSGMLGGPDYSDPDDAAAAAPE